MPPESKKPVNTGFTGLKVESEGFEPSSKQVIKKLSTRLVFI